MTVQSLRDEIETLNEEKGRPDNEVVYLYHQLFIDLYKCQPFSVFYA